MGDRALIQFENAGEISPVIYLHWHGDAVRALLDKCNEYMEGRRGDVSYCAARFVGICHETIDGNLSLGIWNNEKRLTKEDSHGDAGCFVVNAASFDVDAFGGYGLSEPPPPEYGEPHRCDPSDRWELYDARGISCGFVCDKCEAEKRRQYRPEIFRDPGYYADEPLDPEPGVVSFDDESPTIPFKCCETPPEYGLRNDDAAELANTITNDARNLHADISTCDTESEAREQQRIDEIFGPPTIIAEAILTGCFAIAEAIRDRRDEVNEDSPDYVAKLDGSGTNITDTHREVFNALRDPEIENLALFSCFVNGVPTSAIVSVHQAEDTIFDDEIDVVPHFVAITPEMILKDHDDDEPEYLREDRAEYLREAGKRFADATLKGASLDEAIATALGASVGKCGECGNFYDDNDPALDLCKTCSDWTVEKESDNV